METVLNVSYGIEPDIVFSAPYNSGLPECPKRLKYAFVKFYFSPMEFQYDVRKYGYHNRNLIYKLSRMSIHELANIALQAFDIACRTYADLIVRTGVKYGYWFIIETACSGCSCTGDKGSHGDDPEWSTNLVNIPKELSDVFYVFSHYYGKVMEQFF